MSEAAAVCADCGAAAFPGERLARAGWGRRSVCPHCHEQRRARGLLRDVLLLIGFVALARLASLPIAHLLTACWLNLSFLIVALGLGVVVHEAGHAFAARTLGFEVHAVRLGQGRLRRAFELAGMRWEWRGWPDAGLLVASRTEPHGLLPRLLALVLAGPAVTVASALLLAAFAGPPREWLAAMVAGPAPLHAALFAHLLLAAACLVPWMSRIGGQPHPSDALLALLLLIAPATHVQQHAQAAWALRAEARRRAGDAAGARELLEQGLALHPSSLVLEHDRTRLRLDRGEWREARAEFEALLTRPEAAAAPVRQLVATNAAFAALLSDEAALHEAAARESLALLREGATSPACVGTHALALVRTGEVAAGAAMAERLERETTEPEIAAGSLATQALAAHLRGDASSRDALLERARRLDPTCSVSRLVNRPSERAAKVA